MKSSGLINGAKRDHKHKTTALGRRWTFNIDALENGQGNENGLEKLAFLPRPYFKHVDRAKNEGAIAKDDGVRFRDNGEVEPALNLTPGRYISVWIKRAGV